MKKVYGAIRKTDDGYEATYERILKHPPEKVWRSITEPARIKDWYVRTELEPRVGGHYVEHHDHVGMSMEGEVTRFEPPHAFEHTWWGDKPEGERDAAILWEIHPHEEGSRLVMTYRFPSLEGAHGAMAGWHICIDVLCAVLDGESPDAHQPPQGTFADGEFTSRTPGKGLWTRHEALEAEYADIVSASPRLGDVT